MDTAKAQYEQAALILENLESISTEAVGVFRLIIGAYDGAYEDLERICESAPPALVEAISGPLDEFDCFDIPSPNAAVLEARKHFPSWEAVRADIIQDQEDPPTFQSDEIGGFVP